MGVEGWKGGRLPHPGPRGPRGPLWLCWGGLPPCGIWGTTPGHSTVGQSAWSGWGVPFHVWAKKPSGRNSTNQTGLLRDTVYGTAIIIVHSRQVTRRGRIAPGW